MSTLFDSTSASGRKPQRRKATEAKNPKQKKTDGQISPAPAHIGPVTLTLPERAAYSEELAEMFCFNYATSKAGLRALCEEPGMPAIQTIMYWRHRHPEFNKQFLIAQQVKVQLLAEDALAISEGDGSADDIAKVQRDKLRVQTVQWLAAKYYPKVFGTVADPNAGIAPNLGAMSPEQFNQLLETAVRASGQQRIGGEYVEHEEVK